MEATKKRQLFRKSFWLGFGVKQIIDSLSFLFLLTQIGLNFNEKYMNDKANHENLDLSRVFLKKITELIRQNNVLKIIPYFPSAIIYGADMIIYRYMVQIQLYVDMADYI